jgi:hypothetical protein
MIAIPVIGLVVGIWWMLATLLPRFKHSRTRAMQLTGISFVLLIVAGAISPRQAAPADDGSQARAGFSVACKNLLLEQLKAPDSAKIPNYYDGDGFTETKTSMTWTDELKAQNAFGVMLRTKFLCLYDKKSQRTTAQLLNN